MDGNEMGGVIGGGLSLVATIGGYLLKSHSDRLRQIEANHTAIDKDLSAHKLESERRYAKEETLQLSLSRIHDRLDFTATKDDLVGLKNDIKSFFHKV